MRLQVETGAEAFGHVRLFPGKCVFLPRPSAKTPEEGGWGQTREAAGLT